MGQIQSRMARKVSSQLTCNILYNLNTDPQQLDNVIERHTDIAGDIHKLLVEFMRENEVPERLLQPRLELRL